MAKAAIVSIAAIAISAVVWLVLNRDNSYDRSFDTRVANPAYRDSGPVVLYDEGHLNSHTTTAAYKPLADMIRSDGYRLRTTSQPFSAAGLNGAAVLVLVLARGSNQTNDSAAYTDAETAAIAEWVRGGGALFLITDHWPYGLAARSLGRRFGVEMGAGLVEDPVYHLRERGASHLIFSDDNGLLKAHPITSGRNAGERVHRVLTFTGQSLQGPAGAVAFLQLSDSAIEYPPGPAHVETRGGDVRVSMEYGKAIPARGRAQGLALEFGRGRVVALGEAGMLRAQQDRTGLVGMNVPGYDNRQLALNIMHWLSRVI